MLRRVIRPGRQQRAVQGFVRAMPLPGVPRFRAERPHVFVRCGWPDWGDRSAARTTSPPSCTAEKERPNGHSPALLGWALRCRTVSGKGLQSSGKFAAATTGTVLSHQRFCAYLLGVWHRSDYGPDRLRGCFEEMVAIDGSLTHPAASPHRTME